MALELQALGVGLKPRREEENRLVRLEVFFGVFLTYDFILRILADESNELLASFYATRFPPIFGISDCIENLLG